MAKTQTVQQTSKWLKLLVIIAVLICAAGVFIYQSDGETGVLTIIGGIALFCVTKFLIWWNHG